MQVIRGAQLNCVPRRDKESHVRAQLNSLQLLPRPDSLTHTPSRAISDGLGLIHPTVLIGAHPCCTNYMALVHVQLPPVPSHSCYFILLLRAVIDPFARGLSEL
jgi:hypothetical protein